ncbi:MAG: hypothetical protein A4E28_00376 [Methanocella sp. PtaU1.Bin125]|nr:MAG: hypothetical protein A4E28_00376 [Methanocella sp. PtaU1.Bin125]
MVICPTCGSPECVRPAEDLIAGTAGMYAPCNLCAAERPLDKLAPFSGLGRFFDRDAGRCPACGKRHIDYVMAQVLGILVSRGLKSGRTPLKDAGSPLIACGFELFEAPRLGSKSLIVLLDHVDRAAAELILAEVPEVKGVLKRSGGPLKSVGLSDVGVKPHTYELLAGCDMRSDIVSSLLGEMAFYRNHRQMHVEFWRNNSVKIKVLEQLFLDGGLEGRTVVDGMASAGTLGLLTATAGARRVILNDAWLPAVKNILLNIEVNKKALGVELRQIAAPESLPLISKEPTLVARASGAVEIDVYHADLRRLAGVVKECDVCIIDTFPGISPDAFVKAWKGITKDRIITL